MSRKSGSPGKTHLWLDDASFVSIFGSFTRPVELHWMKMGSTEQEPLRAQETTKLQILEKYSAKISQVKSCVIKLDEMVGNHVNLI